MPTTIHDASQITLRRQRRAEAGDFIRRIQNTTAPQTGYAPRLGVFDQSIINDVRMGTMAQYTKCDGGATSVSSGCPCDQASNN